MGKHWNERRRRAAGGILAGGLRNRPRKCWWRQEIRGAVLESLT